MENLKKNTSEKLLFKGFIEGNEKAFKKLFDYYKDTIYSYALGLSKCKLRAEKIVEAVFLKVWSNRENMNISLSFKKYLYDYARKEVYDFLVMAASDKQLCHEVFYKSQKSYDPNYGNFK